MAISRYTTRPSRAELRLDAATEWLHLERAPDRVADPVAGQRPEVVRRLRAMLENLIETLPELRAPLLRRELSLLESSALRTFPDAEDRELAVISDLQGMGGSRAALGPRRRGQDAKAVSTVSR